MLIDRKKVNETLFLIFLGVVFFSLILILYKSFSQSETDKILNKDLKEIKVNQKQILLNEKISYKAIDSLKKVISQNEKERDGIIEKHYYTKEIINEKIQQDEKDIINSSADMDSIKRYISNYKYTPIR